jgi:hypothetical protein
MPACSENLRNKTFELPLQGDKTQVHQITGGKQREEDSLLITFDEPLRFKKVGQTIDAFTYLTLTQGSTGEAFCGQFAVQATLRKGYTGGPPGFATELFIEAGPLRFVKNLAAPPTPPGVRGIVPGQEVVRMIPQGQVDKVDDRYWIDLPLVNMVDVWVNPFRSEHELGITLTRENKPMASQPDVGHYVFKTDGPGIYEIRIVGRAAAKEPDRYSFFVAWGHMSNSKHLKACEVEWRRKPDGEGR